MIQKLKTKLRNGESTVTLQVRASHSADRCANCRFGKRAYAFSCQTAGTQLVWKANVPVQLSRRRFERNRKEALCKLSVWLENVSVWLSHRWFERRTETQRCAICRFAKRTSEHIRSPVTLPDQAANGEGALCKLSV